MSYNKKQLRRIEVQNWQEGRKKRIRANRARWSDKKTDQKDSNKS